MIGNMVKGQFPIDVPNLLDGKLMGKHRFDEDVCCRNLVKTQDIWNSRVSHQEYDVPNDGVFTVSVYWRIWRLTLPRILG